MLRPHTIRFGLLLLSVLVAAETWGQELTITSNNANFNSAEQLSKLNLVDLEAQLVNGLRLTNSQQKQYVATVVAAVRQQRIPRAMVNVVYLWALKRNDRYPFPYFRIALNTLAARRGVSLP